MLAAQWPSMSPFMQTIFATRFNSSLCARTERSAHKGVFHNVSGDLAPEDV